jgi:hypothetical protein
MSNGMVNEEVVKNILANVGSSKIAMINVSATSSYRVAKTFFIQVAMITSFSYS